MQATKVSQLFTLLLMTAACLPVHGARRHYCNKNTQVLSLNKGASGSTFDAELIPRLVEEPDGLNPLTCEWQIQFDPKDYANRQLILIAEIDKSREALDQEVYRNRSDLLFGWGRANIAVSSGTFHVYPLIPGKTLYVANYWDPKTQINTPFKLRLLIPPAGTCPASSMASKWFSYRGNCYTVSGAQQGFAAAINSTGGDAQLASFSSKTEFNSFVITNADQIDLYKPVRLGMFYRAADAALLNLVRRQDGVCDLKKIPPSHRIKLPAAATANDTVGCASLRVDNDSKRQIIEFEDCKSSLPSLLTFPMTAGDRAQVNCNCNTSRIQAELDKPPIEQPTTKQTRVIIRKTILSSISSPKVASIGHYWIIIGSIGPLMLSRIF